MPLVSVSPESLNNDKHNVYANLGFRVYSLERRIVPPERDGSTVVLSLDPPPVSADARLALVVQAMLPRKGGRTRTYDITTFLNGVPLGTQTLAGNAQWHQELCFEVTYRL